MSRVTSLDLGVSKVLSQGSFLQLQDILFFSNTQQVSCLRSKFYQQYFYLYDTFNTSIGGLKFFILKVSTFNRDVELVRLYILRGGASLKYNFSQELIESFILFVPDIGTYVLLPASKNSPIVKFITNSKTIFLFRT